MEQSAIKIHGYEPQCPICMESWNPMPHSGRKAVIPWALACGHMICEICLMKHKLGTRKCHMCREKFSTKSQRRQRHKANTIQRRGRIKQRIREELEIYNETRDTKTEIYFQ